MNHNLSFFSIRNRAPNDAVLNDQSDVMNILIRGSTLPLCSHFSYSEANKFSSEESLEKIWYKTPRQGQ